MFSRQGESTRGKREREAQVSAEGRAAALEELLRPVIDVDYYEPRCEECKQRFYDDSDMRSGHDCFCSWHHVCTDDLGCDDNGERTLAR